MTKPRPIFVNDGGAPSGWVAVGPLGLPLFEYEDGIYEVFE